MSSIFNDLELLLKWDDSVPQISSIARKRQLNEEAMGDRVDMRVLTRVDGNMYDTHPKISLTLKQCVMA
ncbi:hypothetical protein BDF14DRAFT_1797622 [Spinellus fusiger]|nr:hypothetical protein BDF14DRAFT_1797622 [Spinellus fusiger]